MKLGVLTASRRNKPIYKGICEAFFLQPTQGVAEISLISVHGSGKMTFDPIVCGEEFISDPGPTMKASLFIHPLRMVQKASRRSNVCRRGEPDLRRRCSANSLV